MTYSIGTQVVIQLLESLVLLYKIINILSNLYIVYWFMSKFVPSLFSSLVPSIIYLYLSKEEIRQEENINLFFFSCLLLNNMSNLATQI